MLVTCEAELAQFVRAPAGRYSAQTVTNREVRLTRRVKPWPAAQAAHTIPLNMVTGSSSSLTRYSYPASTKSSKMAGMGVTYA